MTAWGLLLLKISCWQAAVPAQGGDLLGSFFDDVAGQLSQK